MGGRARGALSYRRTVTAVLLGAPAEIPLVGRERELDRIEELVASIDRGPRFVVISGDAGIGKTSLWRWASHCHRRAGHRTLVTRASEEDLNSPIVGLVDLFDTARIRRHRDR